jgi:fructokinase
VSRTIAVVGETIVDLIPTDPRDQFLVRPGGSPANVAVGLARLGVPVRLIARTGSDNLAQQIRQYLLENGVDLSAALATHDRTAIALVDLDEHGNPVYDFRVEGAADWGWTDRELLGSLDDTIVALHGGSLSATMEPGRGAVLRMLERAHATTTVSYDLNCRPTLMGSAEGVRNSLAAVLPSLDIIRASVDDIAWLLPGQSPEVAADDWLRAGPCLVVVTLGADGAFALSSSGRIDCSGRTVDVVDTVGAGDAFTSALLAGLARRSLLGAEKRSSLAALDPASLYEIVDDAILAASLTCARKGAQPPTHSEIANSQSSELIARSS